MRNAKAEDYWRKLKKKRLKSFIKEINLGGYNGINNIEMSQGIYCLCGLNGVGKSTIIAAMKDVIGLKVSKQDRIKIGNNSFSGKIFVKSKEYFCENEEGKRLCDQVLLEENIIYLDFAQAINVLSFYYDQENLEELIEQSDENEFVNEIAEINYLVGRDYEKVSVMEFEDIEKLGTIPFFKVVGDGCTYDTRKMGMGEHFLLYMYWALYRAPKSSIIIIEEPESFVGIKSQTNFMNILARICLEKECSFVLTTHSPYILERIENENISIIGRASKLIGISRPKDAMTAEVILGSESRVAGTIFVEDTMAKEFLHILLEEECSAWARKYLIESLGSSGEMKKYLSLKRSCNIKYIFIGAFDADQKDEIDYTKINWPVIFLPVRKDVESEIRHFLSVPDNVKLLAQNIGKTIDEVVIALSTVTGEDHHDWIIDLTRTLSVDMVNFVRIIYMSWRADNRTEIDKFLDELYKCEDS